MNCDSLTTMDTVACFALIVVVLSLLAKPKQRTLRPVAVLGDLLPLRRRG